MIVPDVNLLLYAYLDGFAEHVAARRWWEEALNGTEEIGLTAPAAFGFIRIATNPKIFETPMGVDDAVKTVEEWLGRSRVQFLVPGPHHLEIAFELLRELGAAANLTTDVQLAAYAIEHQAELHSSDAGFGRFARLRWTNPLLE